MSKGQISCWFDTGLTLNYRYMSVYRGIDTYYVRYAKDYEEFICQDLQPEEPMEVYDLTQSKESQLREYRAYYMPEPSAPKKRRLR